MKKGELSINMIIVAVIAIVILVIIVFLVLKSFDNTDDATECLGKGGICVDACNDAVINENGPINCPDAGQVCCKPGGRI